MKKLAFVLAAMALITIYSGCTGRSKNDYKPYLLLPKENLLLMAIKQSM